MVLELDISKPTGVVVVIIYCLNVNLCFPSNMPYGRKRDICAKVRNLLGGGKKPSGLK